MLFWLLIFLNLLAYSQDSLVKLEKGYFFKDSIPNSISVDGLKYGKWIEIEYEYEVHMMYHIETRGEDSDFYTYLDTSETKFISFWIGEYEQGNKIGIWYKYDKDYTIISEYEYLNGKIINFETYYTEGVLKMKGVLQKDSVNINVVKYEEDGSIIERKDYSLTKINDIFGE